MAKTIYQLINEQKDLQAQMANADETKYRELLATYNANAREIQIMNQEREAQRTAASVDRGVALREIMRERKQLREISLEALQVGDDNNIRSAGAVALTIHDIIPNLEKGLIWDIVGLRIQYGVKGDVVWPYATTNVEAEEVGENVSLTDKDIDFANKKASPARVGISILVSNEAIDNADFDLLGYVRTQLTLAVQRHLNKKMFSPANWSGIAGPFKNMSPTEITGTYANIIAERSKIAAAGVDMSSFAYVVSNRTYALLQSTPKFNGQGGAIIENGRIDGDPVFVTEYINQKASGTEDSKYLMAMGCFAYVAANQHGVVRLIVDPVTEARKNATVLTLNADWSITDLATAEGAWALLDITPANSGTVDVNVKNDSLGVTIDNDSLSVTVDNEETSPIPTKEVTSGAQG